MAREWDNECCGCEHCRNCGRREDFERFFCDECGEEGRLYDYNGTEICEECLVKHFDVIEGSEVYI